MCQSACVCVCVWCVRARVVCVCVCVVCAHACGVCVRVCGVCVCACVCVHAHTNGLHSIHTLERPVDLHGGVLFQVGHVVAVFHQVTETLVMHTAIL